MSKWGLTHTTRKVILLFYRVKKSKVESNEFYMWVENVGSLKTRIDALDTLNSSNKVKSNLATLEGYVCS